jgi:uncharacterized membrane protein YbhN (UPF0104 family)
MAASIAAALIPTPGGLGSLDAALTVALVAAGAHASTATGAVLAYRLIAIWLPMLPSTLVLGVLVRRQVI